MLALGLDELGRKKSEEIALSRLKPAYYDEDADPSQHRCEKSRDANQPSQESYPLQGG